MSSLELDIFPPNRPSFSIKLDGDQAPYMIGRRTHGKQKADIVISDRRLERFHCQIDWNNDGTWLITDLETKSGTTIDGREIENRTRIRSSSEIRLGATKIYPRCEVNADQKNIEVSSEAEFEMGRFDLPQKHLTAERRVVDVSDDDATVLVEAAGISESGGLENSAAGSVMNGEPEYDDETKLIGDGGTSSEVGGAAEKATKTPIDVLDLASDVIDIDRTEHASHKGFIDEYSGTQISAEQVEIAFIRIMPKDEKPYDVMLSNEQSEFSIGRGQQGGNLRVDIGIPDKYISARHCKLGRNDDGNWILTDLNSSNGTIVRGITIEKPFKIEHGTEFMAGTTRLSFNLKVQSSFGERIYDVEGNNSVSRNHVVDAKINNPNYQSARTYDRDQKTIGSVGASDSEVIDHSLEKNENGQTVGSVDSMSEKTKQLVSTPDGLADGRRSNYDPIIRDLRSPDDKSGSNEEYQVAGIGKELIEENLLDVHRARMIGEIARKSGKTFFRALISEETIRLKDEIYNYIGESQNLTVIRTENELRDKVALADWLPANIAGAMGVLTMLPDPDGRPRYATIDPFDIRNNDWLRRKYGEEAQKVLILPDAFKKTLHRLEHQLDSDDVDEVGISVDYTDAEARVMEANITNANVPELVNYLLYRGSRQGASDIHVEPMEDQLAIRNRVDGVLHHDTMLPLEIHSEIVSRVKILSDMDVAEKRRPQDGRISALIQNSSIDVRVSTFPTVYGEKIVMRLLDKNALSPSPDTLGLMPMELRVLKDKIKAPFGLIMISGPTGSGKTTTLYSCLGSIDKNAKNVLTVEDPVEYRLAGVHQLQVNEKIGLSFASGLRTMLRQDPDVIMIGECRDEETASMAIQAALTGHIVFSTIHTNDAVGVVTRLLDMEIDPFLVANSLSLAVAQRLVRCICGHCKTSIEGREVLRRMLEEGVSEERLSSLGIFVDVEIFYTTGAGCLHCHGTGYQGRQAVFEMFEMTGEARKMIMSPNFDADELRRVALAAGMSSLIEHGMQLVDEGTTTLQELIRVLGEKY